MYTATAIYQGSEIGFGEGYGDAYAVEECVDSIELIYKQCANPSEIRLIVRRDDTGDVAYVTSLTQYSVDTEY